MTPMRVSVDLVPGPPAPAGGRDADAGVAIDVLRATTTLSVARANGAAGVIAFADPAAAVAHRAAHPGVLACGERGGRIVPGFDLGNSPFEFGAGLVAGRTLAFASTNGSRALLALANCRTRLLGAFVTATAVHRALAGAASVRIVCAGKEGAFALEDAACAGWLVARLLADGAVAANDAARFVASLAPDGADGVRALVEGCDHARDLASLGEAYVRDVAFCATLDAVGAAQTF